MLRHGHLPCATVDYSFLYSTAASTPRHEVKGARVPHAGQTAGAGSCML